MSGPSIQINKCSSVALFVTGLLDFPDSHVGFRLPDVFDLLKPDVRKELGVHNLPHLPPVVSVGCKSEYSVVLAHVLSGCCGGS